MSVKPSLLDESTRRRLEAQLPQTGGDLLQGYNAMARDVPVWLGLTVVGIVLGGRLLAGILPELGGNAAYLVWSLLLTLLIVEKTRGLRAAAAGSAARDRQAGLRWSLIGVLVLVLPQPLRPPAGVVATIVKWPLALIAFGLGFERLVLRPRRAARVARRTHRALSPDGAEETRGDAGEPAARRDGDFLS